MPFFLTWLPRVLLDAGLKVAEQPGWRDRGRGDVGAIRGVICHHTAGPLAGNMPRIQNHHQRASGIFSDLSPSLVWDAMARCMWLQPDVQPTRDLAIGRASRAVIRISLGSKLRTVGSLADRKPILGPQFRWMPIAEA